MSKGTPRADLCAMLNRSRVDGPAGARKWTPDLARSAEEAARRRGMVVSDRAPKQGSPRARAARAARAASTSPPVTSSATAPASFGGEDLIAAALGSSAVGELARAELARWVSMDPSDWQTYMSSAEGRTALRRVSAAAMLEQVAQASADGSASSATRAVGLLAKLTDTLRAPDVADDPLAAMADLERLTSAALEALPVIQTLVGRDRILAALGLREAHVAPTSPASS